MREVRTFKISEGNADATLAKFHKIASRGKSKGLEGGFTVLGISDEIYKDSDGVEYQYKVIEVECEPVKFSGWEFLAVAEIEQGVVFTRGIGSSEEVKPSQVVVGYCDHCQTTRARKKYIFVKNETGQIKQVGSTCVKDFLGWEFAPTFLQDWSEFEEYASLSSGPSGIDTLSIATAAVAVVAKDGYRSASQFGYSGSTAFTVSEIFKFGSKDEYTRNLKRYYEIETFSDEQKAKGQELIDFAKTFAGDSAYAENLRAAAGLQYQSSKTIGIFVSAIIAKQKAEEQEVAKKTAKVYKSEQYAETGERVEIEVTALSSRVIESEWGSSTLWTFESGDYKFKWFDSGYKFTADIGEVFKIKATIKGLDEYQGQYATKLSRVARVDKKLPSYLATV